MSLKIIVPVAAFMVFGCFSLLAYFADQTGASGFFAIFAIAPQYLFVLYVNCRLAVHKSTFTYRTVFRQVYPFHEKDVISIKDI